MQFKTMNDSEIISLYRNRFKNSLVGKWISAEGTFSKQRDVFEFFENGQGVWLSSGANYEEKTNFYWRQKGPLAIEIREEDEGEWFEIEYDFKIIENDVSTQVILCQKNFETFYLAVTKITYCEPIK